MLVTKDGSIIAEIVESAAPRTLRRLAELIRGRPAEVTSEGGAAPLTFNYTRPHIEIIIGPLDAKGTMTLENELDARALGLDDDRIGRTGEAMDVLQQELVPALNRRKKVGTINPRLQQWMQAWQATHDAEFLVGVSRMEINEALGYVYINGLDSRPVKKGALMLEPASPTHATTRLAIALQDFPVRLGRQMVIGRVVEGLELADDISTRPLDVEPGMRSRDYAPRNPVVVESLVLECR